MIEICVLINNDYCLSHYCTSVKVIVTNLKNQQQTKVMYASPQISDEKLAIAKAELDSHTDGKSPYANIVKLYSDKNYDGFVKEFNAEFSDRKEWNPLTKNCAAATDFVLNYFFPKATCGTAFYKATQIVFGLGCVATLGLFKCWPAPPCFPMPNDIFRKAKLLSLDYGTPLAAKTEEKDECKAISMSAFLA